MKKVYLIHGFNVRDHGERTTDKFRPYFEEAGYKVQEFDYLWTGLIKVRLCNNGLAHVLMKLADENSIAVGHSNGCAIINKACHMGAKFSQVVYINPALNYMMELAPQIERAHVWHSPSDKTVRVARLLPMHSWGKMGAVGYKGNDNRYINYNKEDDFEMSSYKHSDVFYPGLIEYFGPRIVGALENG